MKKIWSLLALFALLATSPATLQAQHHRHGGYGLVGGLRAVESVAGAAMLGSSIHSLDDYTGIRFGYNAASLRADLPSDPDCEFISGLNVGIVFGWYLGSSHFIFEPGLMYSMKGGQLSNYALGYKEKVKTTMHTFEIPLVFKYEVAFHNAGCCLHPFFGGFVAFGLGGKSKYSDEATSYRESWSTFGDGDDQLGRTDAGLRMGCGLGVDNFFVELSYDLGLVDLASDTNYFGSNGFDDGVYSNTVGISLGFNF